MSKIVPNKIYALPAREPIRAGDEITPEELINLLDAIKEHIDESQRAIFSSHITRHIGKDSTYALKSEAFQGLKIIHDRFMDKETKASEKAMIALKLQERAEECTPGFHNGINEVLDGFFLASHLNDLMYRMRQDIVARTATRISDDTHVNNRCFVIAETSGYGVHPINRNDQYLNHRNDEFPNKMIEEELEKSFDKELRIFTVLQGLEDQLRGQLSRAGYEGLKVAGYQLEEFDGIENQLLLLFQDVPEAQALLQAKTELQQKLELEAQNRETAFTEMRRFVEAHPEAFTAFKVHTNLKLRALLGEGGLLPFASTWAKEAQNRLTAEEKVEFFKIKENFEAAQKASRMHEVREKLHEAQKSFYPLFFLKSGAGVTDINWPQVRQLLWQGIKRQQYFESSPEQYIDVIMNPSTSDIEKADAYKVLLRTQNLQDLLDLLVSGHPPEHLISAALSEYFSKMPGEPYQAFKSILSSGLKHEVKRIFFQAHFSQFHAAIKEDTPFFIEIIVFMTQEQLVQDLQDAALLRVILDENMLVKLLREKKLDNFKLLIHAISQLSAYIGKEFLKRFFTQIDKDGRNALMRVVADNPASIKSLIEGMLQLPEGIREEVLERVFTQTDKISRNALMWVAAYNPVAIQSLIEGMLQLPVGIRKEVLRSVFTQTDMHGRNVLMRTAAYNHVVIQPLMEGMLRFPEGIGAEILKGVFTEIDEDGRNRIMLETHYRPASIQPLMEGMLQLPEGIREEILNSFFTQTNKENRNVLMRAAATKPEAIQPLMEGMLQLPEGIREEFLNSFFTQTDKDDRNAFMRAAATKPEAIQFLVEGMLQLPDGIGEGFLKHFFIQTDKDSRNELMVAAATKPEAIQPLVNGMLQLPAGMREEVLRNVFTQTDNGYDRNVLMVAAATKPEAIQPLMGGMLQLPVGIREEILKSVFTQTNKNDRNVLIRTVANKPEAIQPLIDGMLQLPDDIRKEILKSAFTQTDNDYHWNVLMWAAADSPEAIQPLVNGILQLSDGIGEGFLKRFFIQTDKDGRNALMVAVTWELEAIQPLIDGMLQLPDDIRKEILKSVFTQTDRLGKNALMVALEQRPEAVEPLKACLSTLPGDIKDKVFQQASRSEKPEVVQQSSAIQKELTASNIEKTKDIKKELEQLDKGPTSQNNNHRPRRG